MINTFLSVYNNIMGSRLVWLGMQLKDRRAIMNEEYEQPAYFRPTSIFFKTQTQSVQSNIEKSVLVNNQWRICNIPLVGGWG